MKVENTFGLKGSGRMHVLTAWKTNPLSVYLLRALGQEREREACGEPAQAVDTYLTASYY